MIVTQKIETKKDVRVLIPFPKLQNGNSTFRFASIQQL